MPTPTVYQPTILVTGATGFLGGAFAADLLVLAEWDRVVFLVRAEDDAHAYLRMLRSLARFSSSLEQLGRLKHEQVVAGDFTQPEAFVADQRLMKIKQVVHCAARTLLGNSLRVFAANLDGTQRLVHHLRPVAPTERFQPVSPATMRDEDDLGGAIGRFCRNNGGVPVGT